ncbi:MAG: hypothetical protein ACR2F6_05250 [Mycobacteriales bacterium]
MYTDPKSLGQFYQEHLAKAANERLAYSLMHPTENRREAVQAVRGRIGGGLTRVGARIAGQAQA